MISIQFTTTITCILWVHIYLIRDHTAKYYKVQLFWEGQKNLKNLSLVLTLLIKNSCFVKTSGIFFSILWTSHYVYLNSTHLVLTYLYEYSRKKSSCAFSQEWFIFYIAPCSHFIYFYLEIFTRSTKRCYNDYQPQSARWEMKNVFASRNCLILIAEVFTMG